MNKLLVRQLQELISIDLDCERQLRIGAATLSRAQAAEVTATTVVGARGTDDPYAVSELVEQIASEFNLDANVRFGVTSFSVRFTTRER
jgi:hypothetical protein